MNIRRYILALVLSLTQFATAQQQTEQQKQRVIQPVDRQVNADLAAYPQAMPPEGVTQTQPIPADILVSPQPPVLDPAQVKSGAPHREASTWSLQPTPSPTMAGFSAASPSALKKLPPPASAWTLGPTVNPSDRGFSTPLPQALGKFQPGASAWTLGPGLNATERDLATASMSESKKLPLPTDAGNLATAQKFIHQDAASGMIPASAMAGVGRDASMSDLGRRARGMTSAVLSNPYGTRSQFERGMRPDTAGLFDSETLPGSTQSADSTIFSGRHFEHTDTLQGLTSQGLTSPFASSISGTRQRLEASSASYNHLRHFRVAVGRKSELPPELLDSPEARRALRMASSRRHQGEKSSSCKLRSQCSTLASRSRNKTSYHSSQEFRSSMRLRLESTLGH